jgi:comEA protein
LLKIKLEIVVVSLTALFLAFTIGLFAGRAKGGGVVIQYSLSSPPPVTLDASEIAEPTATFLSPATLQTTEPSPSPLPALEAVPEPTLVIVSAPETLPAQESPPKITTAPQSGKSADGKIRINYATAKELESLPGIGPVLAVRIMEYREKHGAFKSAAQLKNVSGIGDKKYAALKDMVTVE